MTLQKKKIQNESLVQHVFPNHLSSYLFGQGLAQMSMNNLPPVPQKPQLEYLPEDEEKKIFKALDCITDGKNHFIVLKLNQPSPPLKVSNQEWNFQLSVGSNSALHWLNFILLFNCLKKKSHATLQPMKFKTKPSHSCFPRLKQFVCRYAEFSLAIVIFAVVLIGCSDYFTFGFMPCGHRLSTNKKPIVL